MLTMMITVPCFRSYDDTNLLSGNPLNLFPVQPLLFPDVKFISQDFRFSKSCGVPAQDIDHLTSYGVSLFL